MKKILFLCLFLSACSTTHPSESISNSIKNDLKALSSEVQSVGSILPKECKTDAIVGRLNEISIKIKNVSSQVENINLACKTEKQVIEQRVLIRNIFIGILSFLVVVLGYLLLKFKRL